MTGGALIVAFFLAVALMIGLIWQFRVHPFISILLVSLVFGLTAGIPLIKPAGVTTSSKLGIVDVIGQGFGDVFSSVGIVVVCGVLIGYILEATGGAFKLADVVVRLVSKRRPELAMSLMGWIVSIAVFCDSGYVILNPIRRAIVRRTAASSASLTIALAGGLYVSHVFIPPTPGPLAATGALGLTDDLLLVIGAGVLSSIPALIAVVACARFIGKRIKTEEDTDPASVCETYEELLATYGAVPNMLSAVAPILVPIVLMSLGTLAPLIGLTGIASNIVRFLGTPTIALAMGALFGVIQLTETGRSGELYDLVEQTLKTAGPILFTAAAGCAFGKVISNTGVVTFIESNVVIFERFGIFFPFLLAVMFKTAQGSSMISISTTAGIVAPLMATLGITTPIGAALWIMAIGAGSMCVSHANDSYFWIVTNFSGLSPKQGYTALTVTSAVVGVASILGIWLMSLVVGV